MRHTRWWLPLAAILLFGCKSAPPGSAVVVLHVATWDGSGDDDEFTKKLDTVYRNFERENPGVQVKVESVPDSYTSKMVLSHIANASPEVMILDASGAALFINNKLVRDLAPFIEQDKGFKLSDYYPNVVGIATRGQEVFAIPQDFTPMVVYYNKKLFDKARVPYPDGTWNFEQFRNVAESLTIRKPGTSEPVQYGFSFNNWMPGWVMWLWNNGGDTISPDGAQTTGYLDSQQNCETVAFLRDLVNRYHVSPSSSLSNSMGIDLFANGQAAMTVSGHWSLIGYKAAPKDQAGKPLLDWHDLGVTAMPHNGPHSYTVMYESGYAIPKLCKHPVEAWKFIRYMTSHDVQLTYNSTGIAIDARKDVALERSKEPLEKEFLPLIEDARPPYGSRIEGYEFVENQGQSAMATILNSGSPPKTALLDAARRIDKEFAKK